MTEKQLGAAPSGSTDSATVAYVGSAVATQSNPTISGYTEGVVVVGVVTSAFTLDISSGTVLTAILSASTACTFTMPSLVAGKSFVLFLRQPASTGGYGSAIFPTVKWSATGTPTVTVTPGAMDVFSFFSDGINWYGSVSQGYIPEPPTSGAHNVVALPNPGCETYPVSRIIRKVQQGLL